MEPTFPVLWYVVQYPDAGPRAAALAFRSYQDFRVSRDFMRGSDHYHLKMIEFLTEYEIRDKGINFASQAA